jgi:hypothetical protein
MSRDSVGAARTGDGRFAGLRGPVLGAGGQEQDGGEKRKDGLHDEHGRGLFQPRSFLEHGKNSIRSIFLFPTIIPFQVFPFPIMARLSRQPCTVALTSSAPTSFRNIGCPITHSVSINTRPSIHTANVSVTVFSLVHPLFFAFSKNSMSRCASCGLWWV